MKDSKPDWAENVFSSRDPAFGRVFGESWLGPENGLAGLNKREEEELLLQFGPRKERKALKQRRKAEKQAAKTEKRLFRR